LIKRRHECSYFFFEQGLTALSFHGNWSAKSGDLRSSALSCGEITARVVTHLAEKGKFKRDEIGAGEKVDNIITLIKLARGSHDENKRWQYAPRE